MKHVALVIAAALMLPSCATMGTDAPAPLAQTVIDEKGVRLSFLALDGLATASKALVASGVIKPGSPRALAIAGGLEKTLAFLQAASTAQKAGNTADYAVAMNHALTSYEQVKVALAL